jgi:hypothetical protein
MAQTERLITDEQRDKITSFIDDMTERANDLPTHNSRPVDNDGAGAYLEVLLFSGVTLVMDWAYLDAPSTTLLIDTDAPGYHRGNTRHLCECGELYDQLDSELCEVAEIDCLVEYDDANSTAAYDCWQVSGITPY